MVSESRIPCRLDKYIRDSMGWSRKRIQRAWDAGMIEIHGADTDPYRGPAMLIFEGDSVYVEGVRCQVYQAETYVVFNKPGDVITSNTDPRGRRCLSEWLDILPPRVFAVGRLDLETTGLLLLTDDGDLAHVLLHPKHHVEKTYVIRLRDPIQADDPRLQSLLDGVEIPGGTARALTIEVDPTETTLVRMVIDEGRKRQVRRMCRAAGVYLEHLHRERVGPIVLDETMPLGDWRRLRDDEVDAIWDAVGGRLDVRNRKIAALRRKAVHLRDEGIAHHRLETWLKHLDNA